MSDFEDVAVKVNRFFDQLRFGKLADITSKQDIDGFRTGYEKLGYKKGLCPVAEKIYDGIMSLPLYYSLTDSDVDDVIAAVTKLVDYYHK